MLLSPRMARMLTASSRQSLRLEENCNMESLFGYTILIGRRYWSCQPCMRSCIEIAVSGRPPGRKTIFQRTVGLKMRLKHGSASIGADHNLRQQRAHYETVWTILGLDRLMLRDPFDS